MISSHLLGVEKPMLFPLKPRGFVFEKAEFVGGPARLFNLQPRSKP